MAKQSSARSKAAAASETARKAQRDRLIDYCDTFIAEAHGEEICFLNEVFFDWEAIRLRGDTSEVYIAGAFDACIDRQADYIHVSDDALKQAVKEFMREWNETGGRIVPRDGHWHLWRGRREKGKR